MFWWTGCVGCERTCGGRRRRSEPEASREANRRGRSDWRASTAEPAGRTAVEVATRTAKPRPVPAKLEAALALAGLSQIHLAWRARSRWLRQDTVPFLSCPEAQKLRFQGAAHSAALRGPFSPKSKRTKLCRAAPCRAHREDRAPGWLHGAQRSGPRPGNEGFAQLGRTGTRHCPVGRTRAHTLVTELAQRGDGAQTMMAFPCTSPIHRVE